MPEGMIRSCYNTVGIGQEYFMSNPSTIRFGEAASRGPTSLPLQPGDHMDAEEFHRRYLAMPELKKAELIDGVVYMPSPVRVGNHASPQADFVTWLGVYRAFTPGVQAGDNATVRLGKKSEPQPDLMLRILPEQGGSSTTVEDYVTGAPEWLGEVSASTVSYDLHSKLREYYRAGVPEYVVWRVEDRAIDWFVRGDKDYEKIEPENGIYRSRVFPGLWLDAEALIAGDLQRVLAVLQQGLATSEHAEFCDKLRQPADGSQP